MKTEKLTIIPSEEGLGKYYSLIENKDSDNEIYHPFIFLPLKILKEDPKLFLWIFQHELDHYNYYKIPENRGTKQPFRIELIKWLKHPTWFFRQFYFEVREIISKFPLKTKKEEIN